MIGAVCSEIKKSGFAVSVRAASLEFAVIKLLLALTVNNQ